MLIWKRMFSLKIMNIYLTDLKNTIYENLGKRWSHSCSVSKSLKTLFSGSVFTTVKLNKNLSSKPHEYQFCPNRTRPFIQKHLNPCVFQYPTQVSWFVSAVFIFLILHQHMNLELMWMIVLNWVRRRDSEARQSGFKPRLCSFPARLTLNNELTHSGSSNQCSLEFKHSSAFHLLGGGCPIEGGLV